MASRLHETISAVCSNTLLAILLIATCNSALASQPDQVAGDAGDLPNILIIMTDDMGNNTAYLGNPHLSTPNIDELAEQSIRLTNFHQEKLCTPTRASLMTGKYSVRTGAWRTSKGRSMMRPENITLAEVLRDAGYRTGHFGKWHLGEEWPFRPQDQGFEKTVHHKTGGISQVSDYWGNDYTDDHYYHNDEPRPHKGYCTDVFFEEAMRFIGEDRAEPFFVYLATNVTHLPMNVAASYSDPYVKKGLPDKVAKYYGMIDNLDENIGRMLQFLDAEGLLENTIVFFTTDDGAAKAAAFINLGEDDHVIEGWNMGLRGGKGSRYEGGHRVLANLRLPASEIRGENNTLVSVMDVYPTILELAGVDRPDGIDGRSFAAILGDELPPAEDERPIFYNYFNPKDMHSRKDASVIWKNWRLTNASELYDIDADWGQRNDLANEHPELVAQLNDAYDKWDAEMRPYLDEPVRFLLGDARHPVIEMTSQDHYTVKECNAFSQSHVRELKDCNAPLKVTFVSAGKYEFTLSRYPLYTGLTFGKNVDGKGRATAPEFQASLARLTVASRTVEASIGPDDTSVVFEMQLEAGDADLQSWVFGTLNGEDRSAPAYFIRAEYKGSDTMPADQR